MNNTNQIELLLSMFAIQLPTLLVCFVAGVVILGRWKDGSTRVRLSRKAYLLVVALL